MGTTWELVSVVGPWHPVVRLLAENGADLAIKDKQGRTALDFAMGGGGRGRGGAAPAVRQETAALIRELLNRR